MADGKHARYTKAHEHHGSVRPPSRRPEELHPADYTTACAKHKDLSKHKSAWFTKSRKGEGGRRNTYSVNVDRHQLRQAEESVVERGDIAADDEADDARVVELVAPLGDGRAVVHEGVEGGAHAQAGDGAGEEAAEDEQVAGAGRGVAGRHELEAAVEGQAADDGEGAAAQQVRPDVDTLVVHVEEGLQRGPVAAAVGPVPAPQELVVAPPLRQVVPVQQPPERLPDLGLGVLRRRGQRGRGSAAALAERRFASSGRLGVDHDALRQE